jgi:hypothetical protein
MMIFVIQMSLFCCLLVMVAAVLKEETGAQNGETFFYKNKLLDQRQLEILDEHHHKMYLQFNESNHFPHKKAWMALEVVDGLRNEDVVMLVTSTWGKQFFYLRSRYTHLIL